MDRIINLRIPHIGEKIFKCMDIPELIHSLYVSKTWRHLAEGIFLKRIMERCTETDEHGRTPLLWASALGYKNLVEELLAEDLTLLYESQKIDLNAKCPEGKTALMYACENGNKGVVLKLLRTMGIIDDSAKYLFVSDQDANGMTPLMIACKYGHTDIVKVMLEWSGIGITGNQNMTMNFELACRHGFIEMVKMMLDHRTSSALYKKGTNGIPFLRGFVEAWNHVQIDVIRLLCINPYGKSLFELALRVEDYNIIQSLISKSEELDIDWKTAIKKLERIPGLEDIVQILIDDSNNKGVKGLTPIMRACQYGHHELAKKHLLKQNDIDLNVKDWNGRTVLMRECKAGNDATVQILLDHLFKTNGHSHIDCNVRDLDGCTAFILACSSGQESVVRLLTFYAEMGCNIDLNIKSKSGDTGLKIVCQQGHTDIVKQLLQFKDITVPTRKDFQKAWFSINQQIQEMLEEKWKTLTNELGDIDMSEVDNSVTCDEWMEDLEYMDDNSDISNEDISDEDEE